MSDKDVDVSPDGKASDAALTELRGLSSWKITIPIVIGLGVSAWLFVREYQPGTFDAFSFGWQSVLCLLLACLFMLGRDVGYMARIRTLSDSDLSWRASFRIIMLWEFASAVSPSAVGGTSVALFFIHREGVSAGRSTGIVMITSFLDELYFALMFPLVVFVIGYANIFDLSPELREPLVDAAWCGYAIKTIYTAVIAYGLFVNPVGLKRLIMTIFSLPILKRWHDKMDSVGDDIVETARHFRSWPFTSWLRAFGATWISWTSRYWVANAIILAFFGLSHLGFVDHFVVFGKQLVMWIMMLVSPTPGGSGFAEYAFKEFLGGFIPMGAMALVLCWRLISYYPYIVMGAILLPRWVKGIVDDKKNK